MRRSITLLLLLAVLASVAWWLWHWQAGGAPPPDPWRSVPADAVAVMEVADPLATWQRSTETSQYWDELGQDPLFRGIDAALGRLLGAAPELAAKGRKGAPAVLSWAAAAPDSLGVLLAWPVPASPAMLHALGSAFGQELPATLWDGARLTIPGDSLMPALSLGWRGGLLLLSAEPALVAAALSAKDGGVRGDTLFTRARASLSAGADAHLLVRPAFAAGPLRVNGRPLFPEGGGLGGWAALDVRLRPEAVLMNGLLFPATSGPAVQAIRHQRPAKPALIDVLPAGVCRLRIQQVDDPAAYVRDITGKEADSGLFATYAAWVEGNIGTAAAPAAGDSAGAAWAVFTAGDPGAARSALAAACSGCESTEYRGIAVGRVAEEGALAALFGPLFGPFPRPYWAVLSDRVVMAETPAAMRAAIDAWTDRNSLALDPRSGDFFQQFGSGAVYHAWVDVAKARPGATGSLAPLVRATGGMLLQLSPRADGALVATLCLQHAPMAKRAAGTLWTTALPAPLEGPPVLVKDYLSQTVQVLVQDRDHRLSLISCTGKVLWQRPLDGPLLGGVQLVDRYRNGKLQMLCNTARKVYLIDRLGRDVEDWPVELKAAASAPASVFDYERTRDYRVLVPLENGTWLNLGMDGKPVKGWEPPKLPGPAIAAVEHVRLHGKDFLVAPLASGQVAVLDRRGAVRYQPRLRMQHLAAFIGGRAAMAIGDRRMLWADSAGAVLSGTLDGKVDTLSQATSGNAAVFDVDGDGHEEVVRATASALTAEAGNKLLFRANFPDAPGATAFAVPLKSDGPATGLALPEQEQLRLYSPAGELWPGFPIKGCFPFQVVDINLDGVPELVAADAQGVVSAHTLPQAGGPTAIP